MREWYELEILGEYGDMDKLAGYGSGKVTRIKKRMINVKCM